jgi:hypothetical protein
LCGRVPDGIGHRDTIDPLPFSILTLFSFLRNRIDQREIKAADLRGKEDGGRKLGEREVARESGNERKERK